MTLLLLLFILTGAPKESQNRSVSTTQLIQLVQQIERGDKSAIVTLSSITGYSEDLIEDLVRTGYIKKRIIPTKRADVFVARSGPLFKVSDEFFKGFKMALKGSMEIRVFNTEGDPDRAVLKAGKILNEETAIVVGPLSSTEVIKTLEVVNGAGLPLLSPTAYYLDDALNNEFFLPFNLKYLVETHKLFKKLEKLNLRKFVLFYPSTPEGVALLRSIHHILGDLELEMLGAYEFSPDSTEFPGLIERVKETAPDFVFIPFGEPGSRILAFKIRADSLFMPIAGLDEWGKEETLRWLLVGLDNFYLATLKLDSIQLAERERIKESFKRRYEITYGSKPSVFSMKGYDVGKMITELFSREPVTPWQVPAILDSIGIFYGVSQIILLSRDEGFIKILSIKNGVLKEEN